MNASWSLPFKKSVDKEKYLVDSSGRSLSVIVLPDRFDLPVKERQSGTLLRPIFIDGPLVGVSYDEHYFLDARLRRISNYYRSPKWHQFLSSTLKRKAYPLPALLKILFHFIARGHKTIAFLPSFFVDCLSELKPNFLVSSDDLEKFKKLVDMKLIKFLNSENFAEHLKYRTRECKGVLITSHAARYLSDDNGDIDGKAESDYENSSEWGVRGANAVTNTASRQEKPIELRFGSKIEGIVAKDDNTLPIITPLFRPFNHKLVISLDLLKWTQVFEVKCRSLTQPDLKKLTEEGQLALWQQYVQLRELEKMLDGDYPRGKGDKQTLHLIEEVLIAANECQLVKLEEDQVSKTECGVGKLQDETSFRAKQSVVSDESSSIAMLEVNDGVKCKNSDELLHFTNS